MNSGQDDFIFSGKVVWEFTWLSSIVNGFQFVGIGDFVPKSLERVCIQGFFEIFQVCERDRYIWDWWNYQWYFSCAVGYFIKSNIVMWWEPTKYDVILLLNIKWTICRGMRCCFLAENFELFVFAGRESKNIRISSILNSVE